MKYEIDAKKPETLKETWPGEYGMFSHMQFMAGVPQPLFLVTTLKENGNVNACFQSWSAFNGNGGGYYVVITGVFANTHTYKHILREGEFCVNFLGSDYYDACIRTIEHNSEEGDELKAAGLTAEPSKVLRTPRIKEAFMTYECRLVSDTTPFGMDDQHLIIGKVVNAAVEEGMNTKEAITGPHGFMYYMHTPLNPIATQSEPGMVAMLEVARGE